MALWNSSWNQIDTSQVRETSIFGWRWIPFGCRRRLKSKNYVISRRESRKYKIKFVVAITWYLNMEISLQKSSMFSVVKSCSRKTLMATSVPFHMPRKTSPKKPEYNKQSLLKFCYLLIVACPQYANNKLITELTINTFSTLEHSQGPEIMHK